MNNHQKISEQNLNDIEQAIMEKILKREKNITQLEATIRGNRNNTFAVVTWISDGKLHTKTGVSSKRKGDVYNRRTGELLALINML